MRSSIHLSCPWFVISHPGLHIAVLMRTNALIAITLNQRATTLVYLSEHDHQVILEKIEEREKLNHGEYVEEEDYYNDDSDKSDIDAN